MCETAIKLFQVSTKKFCYSLIFWSLSFCCAGYVQCMSQPQEIWSFIEQIPHDLHVEPEILNGAFSALLFLDPMSIVKNWENFNVQEFNSETWLYIVQSYAQTKEKVTLNIRV